MIVKPALAAMLASGLVAPEKPPIILPRPAIVKPESLEVSRHMLLGMPLTIGMLAKPAPVAPLVSTYTGAVSSTANATSYSLSLPIGTASAGRYVVFAIAARSGSTQSGVTIGGSAAVGLRVQAGLSLYRSSGPITSGTTATVAVTLAGSANNCLIYGWSITGAVPVLIEALYDGSSSTANGVIIDVEANGCLIAASTTFNSLTQAWIGVTSRNYQVLEANTSFAAGSDNITTTQLNRVVQPKWSATSTTLTVAGSFRTS